MTAWSHRELANAVERLARLESERIAARIEIRGECTDARDAGAAPGELIQMFEDAPHRFTSGEIQKFVGLSNDDWASLRDWV